MNLDLIQTVDGGSPEEAKPRRHLLAFLVIILAVFEVILAALVLLQTVHPAGTASSLQRAGRSDAVVLPTAVIQWPAGSRTRAVPVGHADYGIALLTGSPGSPVATASPMVAVLGIFTIGANALTLALATFALSALALYLFATGIGLHAERRNHRPATWAAMGHQIGALTRKKNSSKRLAIYAFQDSTVRAIQSWAYRAIRDFHSVTNPGYCVRHLRRT